MIVEQPVVKPVTHWQLKKGHINKPEKGIYLGWVFAGAKHQQGWSVGPETDETLVSEAQYDAAVEASTNIRIG